MEFKIFCNIAL